MSQSRTRLAPYFSRVAYVVRDLEQAREWFTRCVGVSDFVSSEKTFEAGRLKIRGEAVRGDIHLKVAAGSVGRAGQYELQLIQPLSSDDLHARFLARHGAGIHHIGFVVPDFEAAVAELRAEGPPLMEFHSGAHHTAYFDCQPLGSVIEVTNEARASAPMEEHNHPALQSESTAALASCFNQVAYIVRDCDAANRWMERFAGIAGFEVGEMFQGPALNLKFRGQAVPYDFWLKRSVGHMGPGGTAEIEILQPGENENALWQYLVKHGPGANHIGFPVPDFDALTGPLWATGVPPLKDINKGKLHSSWFCVPQGDTYVEVYSAS
jgi:catechol 2,3-dioxygenase-like lactoylglutathione lyase family enzyme